MTETFSVQVGEFEGPLPLLLDLVEKRKLSISQVSLATVADNFLDYVRQLDQPSLGLLAEFLTVASTLMLIKSISLLPTLTLTETESGEVADLEQRLKIYQLIRETSVGISQRCGQRPIFFSLPRSDKRVVFSPTPEITVANLLVTMKNLIRVLPIPTSPLPKVVLKKIVSLEEMIRDLATRVQTALRLNFSEFIRNKKDKKEIIVGFLALLELCKQGAVAVGQTDHFQEINIETTTAGIPRY
ncbi:MAG: segregation/condensation protein A [Patescibacteria group bacterium]